MNSNRLLLPVGIGLGVALFAVSLGSSKQSIPKVNPSGMKDLDPSIDPWGPARHATGDFPPPDPALVGNPNLPEIVEALRELEAWLKSQPGVPSSNWSAREITTMPKAPGQPVAVPPRSLWANMVSTLKIFARIRAQMGVPLSLRGYRPLDYDRAVGGAKNSTHTYFNALDIRATSPDDKRKLALIGAREYLDNPDEKIGLGVYGPTTPSNIPIDSVWRRRTWANSQDWIKKAQGTT